MNALTRASTAICLAVAWVMPGAEEPLIALKSRLTPILARSHIRAKFEIKDLTMTVSFRTAEYQVIWPRRYLKKNSRPIRQMVGPQPDGLLIEINVYDRKRGSYDLPSPGIRVAGHDPVRRYDGGSWSYDENKAQIKGKDVAIHYTISWGDQFNKKVVDRLISAISEG